MFEILQYDFMQRAFLAGLMIAIVAPLIGTFMVVRRFSLMADTLAHVSLVGVATGLVTGINPVITASVTAILAAVGIEKLRSSRHVYGESVLALFLSGSLALATVIVSAGSGINANFVSYLFGSITTVTSEDLFIIAGLGIVVVSILMLFFKELFMVAFDEELSQASGMKAERYNLLLILLAALSISISMRIIGVLLIGALMVIPVITSMQIAKSFKQTLIYSVIFSLLSVMSGLTISYYFDLASGGTIVVMALIIFCICLGVNKLRKN
jgi:zinc transport system permease protein